MKLTTSDTPHLFNELSALIEQARQHIAQAANSTLTLLYWQVGTRIRREVLQADRADYGEQIIASLAIQLTQHYGNGFTETNLRRMLQLAEVFPDEGIIYTLSQQLSWSHFREILPLKQPLERDFYAEICRVERWSVRTLRERIRSQLYLRTAIAKKPDTIISAELNQLRKADKITPDLVFRDPYMLDFLGLSDSYSEQDLEKAILHNIEHFLLEMGAGFCFVARQKRVSVGADDFYLDLLFYHRHLCCLVAIELKLEKFSPSHKGQMELYLRWLDKHERANNEEAPIGLILCASADAEQVELMDLASSHIRVAQYHHQLPELALLQTQLHKAVQLARQQHHLSDPN